MDEVFIDMRKQNRWIQKYFANKDLVSVDDLLNCIEDLDGEIDHWKEKYEDLENDVKENYKFVGSEEPDWHDIQDHEPSWWTN